MLYLAILDDDANILVEHETRISNLFKKHKIDGEIVIATRDYRKFVEVVQNNKVNVAIIDINLKDNINGMHIAKQIRENNRDIEIIFFSGCLNYSQLAYEVKAHWFIEKPNWTFLEITLVNLNKEMLKYKKSIICIECNTGDREDYGKSFIALNDIDYIDRVGNKTCIHIDKDATSVKDTYYTSEGLAELKDRIGDERFQQCHKSIIINTEKIEHINSKYTIITLHSGIECDIGPKFRNYFREWRPLSLC